MAFNQGCRAIVPREAISARFLTYALVSARGELAARGRGTTFMELSAAQMGEVMVPVPTEANQRAIADYLDRETARIDTLIEEQQRLIELLQERRSRVLDALIAGATGPQMPLKYATENVSVGIVIQPAQWYGDVRRSVRRPA
jgi:type I restriction enzyme S subunit